MVDVLSLPTLQAAKSTTFTRPPFDSESLTIPGIYAFHALHSSQHPLFIYADGSTKSGIREINYAEVYAGIQRCHGIVSRYHSSIVGEITKPSTVGILANLDTITYSTFTIGITHAGLTPFPISTRNSVAGVAHLIRSTSIRLLFVSPDSAMQRMASEAVAALEKEGTVVNVLPVPQFEDIYNEDDAFKKLSPVRLSEDPVIIILHSSGSTAQPKPIPMLNSNLISWCTLHYYGELDMAGMIVSAHSLPFFHAFGFGQMMITIGSGSITACFKPANPPPIPTPDVCLRGIVETKAQFVICVPNFIEAWARSPENIFILRNLNTIMFGGAPMNQAVGDKLIAAGVNLIPAYASTEAGPLTTLIPKSANVDSWQYFTFSSHFKFHFRDKHTIGEGELGELVVLGHKRYNPHVLNITVDGQPGYATSDLLLCHPTEKDRYRIYGRADDQLMLSTGEKTNPVPLESLLIQDANITYAIMFGRGRFQNGVLIQPAEPFQPDDEAKLVAFRNLIWPTVELVNDSAPAHSRIFKEMIITVNPKKPLEFTAKGTPRRHVCLRAYEKEIDALYEAVKDSSQADIPVPEVWTVDNAMKFVDSAIKGVLKYPIGVDQDIFSQGCDSLQATWIRNSILRAIRLSKNKADVHQISLNFVYTYPSIQKLGEYFWRVLSGAHNVGEQNHAALVETRCLEMESLVSKYTTEIPTPKWKAPPELSVEKTVLLTGSTGRLGCFILKEFAEGMDTAKIYALNRPSTLGRSSEIRQKEALETWGISIEPNGWKKIVFVEYDPARDRLGLTDDVYSTLQASVTNIIHNGWRVDFNIGLGSFDNLISGTRRLLDLALGCSVCNGPKFVFISSISVFQNSSSDQVAPEAPVPPSLAAGLGYGESKWVTENICHRISETTGLNSSIVRVGQLSGDTDSGRWNAKEWVPALIRAGKDIGRLPSSNELVTWLPVDAAAKAIVELAKQPGNGSQPVAYLNLVHPKPTPWNDIFKPVADYLRLDLVPYDEWTKLLGAKKLALVSGDHEGSGDLIEFLSSGQQGGGGFRTDVALEKCPSLKNVKALEGVDLIKSVNFWKF